MSNLLLQEACFFAMTEIGKLGANHDLNHPLRAAWCKLHQALQAPKQLHELEGLAVSVDVDIREKHFETEGRRYFGTVTEVMEDPREKFGVILLVGDAKPNFNSRDR